MAYERTTNDGTFQYQGAEMLQLTDALANYNDSIAEMVVRFGRQISARAVLDFGAGIGTLSARIQARGLPPVCLEPDADQRAELVRRGLKTVESLDALNDGSLDYIYSSNVLEHIEDDVACLRQMRAKLRTGGRLFLYVPAFQSLYSSMDAEVGHFRRYDRVLLRQKLSDAGFKVDKIFLADFIGYFATLAYKLLGNDTAALNQRSMLLYDRVVFPMSRFIERVVPVPLGKNVVAVATKTL